MPDQLGNNTITMPAEPLPCSGQDAGAQEEAPLTPAQEAEALIQCETQEWPLKVGDLMYLVSAR